MVLWKVLSLVCLYIKMNQSILKPHKEIKAFLFCEMQQSPSLQTPCYHRVMNIEALISGRLKGLAKRREASTLQHKATSPEYQPFVYINKKTKGTTLHDRNTSIMRKEQEGFVDKISIGKWYFSFIVDEYVFIVY